MFPAIMNAQRLFLLSARRSPSGFGLFLVALFLCICPTLCGAQTTASQVTAVPVANLYSMPSRDADVVSQSLLGQELQVIQEKGDWLQVRTPDQHVGWMARDSARPSAPPQRTAQVSSIFANVYRETDVTEHQPLLTLAFEGKVNVAGEDGRWVKLRLPDGGEGWIQRGDVAFDAKVLTISESIELAKRFLGLPYLWGGSSSFGYDCSGFTQMLVRSRGIVMPRDADLQAAWSGLIAVDRKHLRAGDLLFFGDSPKKNYSHRDVYRQRQVHSQHHSRPPGSSD
jgi:cell wall-associated NlpC family hydrolase